MSNSSGEKSEKPTAGKLSKARKKGDIPRSKDVTMAAGLVTSFILLSLFLPYYKALVSHHLCLLLSWQVSLMTKALLSNFC